MYTWVREIPSKLINLHNDDEGATTVEYAVVVAAIVTVAFILLIFGMANPEGDGVTQQAFQNVGDRVGQFGKIE